MDWNKVEFRVDPEAIERFRRAMLAVGELVSERRELMTRAAARRRERSRWRYHDTLCGMTDGTEWEIFQ